MRPANMADLNKEQVSFFSVLILAQKRHYVSNVVNFAVSVKEYL